jgi:CheY-like chemotaxis protein
LIGYWTTLRLTFKAFPPPPYWTSARIPHGSADAVTTACQLEVALSDSLRVLVVDDNRDAADCQAMLLRLWGHQAQIAYSGHEAIDLAKSFQPQVVILDICMHGMHGGEVARHFRQNDALKGALIIAITGHPSNDTRVVAWQDYFDAVLSKPSGMVQIQGLLAAHVASQTESLTVS